jgi:hypothetical protein
LGFKVVQVQEKATIEQYPFAEQLPQERSPAIERHIYIVTDIRAMYESAETICKQEFVKLGFDGNLYYENGIYRTPTMLSCLSHNNLKMREKCLLVFDKKRDFQAEIPSGGAGGIRTLVQTWYKVSFLHA